jgi:tRNA-splicing endonuclease subunit Sen34
VYPGDPLRFHSHFSATSYGWDDEFSMIDIIGGGRLGTRVKKSFLIGGEDPEAKEDRPDAVRTFCVEWGGM